MAVRVKRVYEDAAEGDGVRVLVDRLWPRGVSKGRARVDEWMKEVGPSDRLRKWFGHDPERWAEFVRRYAKELEGRGEEVRRLRGMMRKGTVTLVYGAKDEAHNNAVALAAYLSGRKKRSGSK